MRLGRLTVISPDGRIGADVFEEQGANPTRYEFQDINLDGVPEMLIWFHHSFGKGVQTRLQVFVQSGSYWHRALNEVQSRWAAHVYPAQLRLSGRFEVQADRENPRIIWRADEDNQTAVLEKVYKLVPDGRYFALERKTFKKSPPNQK